MTISPFTAIGNSTGTPLGANETFPGQWINVDSQETVSAVAKSDVAGTLYLDFYYDSVNGNPPDDSTTPDSSLPYTVEAGVTEPPHTLTVARGWFKARYVNGTDAQSTFQLVTRIGTRQAIVAPANVGLAQNADATVVRVIDETTDVSEKKRRGVIGFRKFGRNGDVDSGGTDISHGITGGYTGFPLTAAETFEVRSSSTNDVNTTGSGAWTVRFFYLNSDYEMFDANGDFLYFDIELDGTNWVDSGVDGVRVWRALVLTSGSSNQAFNDGEITCRWDTTTSAVFVVIPAGISQTESAAFTIPTGYKGYLQAFDIEMIKTASANATAGIWRRDLNRSPRILYRKSITQDLFIDRNFVHAFDELPERTDFALRVITVSTTNIAFSGEIVFRLVKQ